ncbi:MAG: hypothetical protein M3238_02485 [Actinomycetota bacterium]|nr:hypothetical protein [Actinomycetota bacterium]
MWAPPEVWIFALVVYALGFLALVLLAAIVIRNVFRSKAGRVSGQDGKSSDAN